MKLVLALFGVLLLIVIVGTYGKSWITGSNFFGISNSAVSIDKQIFNVSVAKTEADREKGLSGTSSLDKDRGMIFVFDKAGKYYFWMKDMKYPLDLVYISNNKIVDIFSNVQPPANGTPDSALPTYVSGSNADHVLEINGGVANKDNFKTGDSVSYSGF